MVQENDESSEQMEEIGEQPMDQQSAGDEQDLRPSILASGLPVDIPEQIGEKSVFHTSRPEGGLRDVLTVECLKLNGDDFKGTITYTEATVKIFQQELGLSSEILHAVKMSFNKCRIVSFKLKEKINIDELVEKENFEMKRSYIVGSRGASQLGGIF